MFHIANYIEAGLWVSIGIAFAAVAWLRAQPARRRAACASVAFVVFGASDVIEAHTGAWWRPWWLLAIKAACILALLTLLWRHGRAGRRPPRV